MIIANKRKLSVPQCLQWLPMLICFVLAPATFSAPQWVSFRNQLNSANIDLSNQPKPDMEFTDNGVNGVRINYSFPGAVFNEETVNGDIYNHIKVDQFGTLTDVGKPALPVRNYPIAVPKGATVEITVLKKNSMIVSGYRIYPALEPAYDNIGAKEPEFEIDIDYYNSQVPYPKNIVSLAGIRKYRGNEIALIQICPIQCITANNEILVYSDISFKVNFTYPKDSNRHSISKIKNTLLRNVVINKSVFTDARDDGDGLFTKLLIVTTDEFKEAADSLALWKRLMGYDVITVSKPTWSGTDEVNDTIHHYGQNEDVDIFAILGDHDDVPSKYSSFGYRAHMTDLFYACLDGGSDFVPDMGYGRISVSTAGEAMTVIQKIINYERNPVTDPSFYQNGINAAYFQHSGSGYAERRFAQTSWEIRGYMIGHQNYNMDRIFVTGSSVNPLYWNNGRYSSGEAIPDSLRRPTFDWSGNASMISNGLNQGRFILFHRDHGSESGWGDPSYNTSHVSALTNGNKLPVVFSINCLTGRFDHSSPCFSEVFLRHSTGGAVGVVAATTVSMSGPNDGFAEALIDAIWPDPGLIPVFPHNQNPTVTPHEPIYEMGNVLVQGKLRLSETWTLDYEQYTYELFHYLGDPSMKIWTKEPATIIATHSSALMIGHNLFAISNLSCDEGIATIYFNGEILGKAHIAGGAAAITLSTVPIVTGTAQLTITSHNFRPYIFDLNVIPGGPAIIPLQPISGVKYDVGEEITIKWQTFERSEILNVHVEFSSDAGITYTDIIASTPNIDSIKWLATSVESDQCIIRISDIDSDPSGLTAIFSIHDLSSISGIVTDNIIAEIHYSGQDSGTVLTDQNGSYAIERLLPGTYSIFAKAGNYYSDTISTIIPPDKINVNFTINLPQIAITPTSLINTIQSGDIYKDTLIISNPGDATLTYGISGNKTGNSIMINEVCSNPDYIELWNIGSDQNMTGWTVSWNDNSGSSVTSFTFPADYIFRAGKQIIINESTGTSNDSTFYTGGNIGWVSSTQLSVNITDNNGDGIDFMRTSANTDTPPAPTLWHGTGISRSYDNIYRNRNEDSDSTSDWASVTTTYKYVLNPGQTNDPVLPNWITFSPDTGVVTGNSFDTVIVTFNSTGMLGGTYHDTVTIQHNAPGNNNPAKIPITLTVLGIKRLSASPLSIYFGNLWTGIEDSAVIELTNNGSETTIVSNITSDNGEFILHTTLPITVLPMGTVSFTTIFTPTSVGVKTGTITITSNAEDAPVLTITLQGTGTTPPAITTTPEFFSIHLNTGDSITENMTITNTGGDSLIWDIIGKSVAIGSNEITDSIPGSQEKPYTCNHDLTTRVWNDAGNDAFDGFGNPSIQVGGITQNLCMLEGDSSYTVNGYKISVRNAFAENHIYRMIIEPDAGETTDRSDILINLNGNMGSDGAEVNYMDSVTIDNLSIPYYINEVNFPNSDPRVAFMILPSQPQHLGNVRYWQHSSGYVDMEATEISLPATVYIIPSYYDLDSIEAWFEMEISANLSSWFTSTSTGSTLNPGAFANIPCTFSAKDLVGGIYYDTLNINHNAPGSPNPITIPLELTVTGIKKLNVTPTVYSYTNLWIGKQDTSMFILENTGSEATIISDITSDNNVFTIISPIPLTIAAFDTDTLGIVFTPLSTGQENGVITITSNAEDNPVLTISINGEGITPPGIVLSSQNFVKYVQENGTNTDILDITNNGGDILEYKIDLLSPGIWPSWLVMSHKNNSIQPLTTDKIDLSFDANGLESGTYNVQLILAHNIPDIDPITISIILTVGEFSPGVSRILSIGQSASYPAKGNTYSLQDIIIGSPTGGISKGNKYQLKLK